MFTFFATTFSKIMFCFSHCKNAMNLYEHSIKEWGKNEFSSRFHRKNTKILDYFVLLVRRNYLPLLLNIYVCKNTRTKVNCNISVNLRWIFKDSSQVKTKKYKSCSLLVFLNFNSFVCNNLWDDKCWLQKLFILTEFIFIVYNSTCVLYLFLLI